MLARAKKHFFFFFMRKEIALVRVSLVKYLLQAPLKVQYIDFLEKQKRFLNLDLKTKLKVILGGVYVGCLYVRFL